MKHSLFFVIISSFCMSGINAQENDHNVIEAQIKLWVGRAKTYRDFVEAHQQFAKRRSKNSAEWIEHLMRAYEWKQSQEYAEKKIEMLETLPRDASTLPKSGHSPVQV